METEIIEVELPDGTILEVPEGADVPAVVKAYLSKQKPAAPAEDIQMFPEKDKSRRFGPFYWDQSGRTEPEDNPFTVALGESLARIGKNATRMALPKGLEPEWASDESMAEQKKVRESLEGQPGAGLGGFAGETIPTLPLGGPVASGGKALVQAAAKAPQALRWLPKALGSAPSRAGVEGAVDAVITSDPGEAGGAAALGGTIGSSFSVLGKTGRRLFPQGLVRKGQAAQDLQHLASQNNMDIFQPLAQAADKDDLFSGVFRSGYREGVPLIPGTSDRLMRQADTANEQIRKIAFEEATPEGVVLKSDVTKNSRRGVTELRDQFRKEYQDTLHKYDFVVPPYFRDDVVARIKKAKPGIDDVTLNSVATEADKIMARYSSGKNQISGSNISEVKNEIRKLWGKFGGSSKPAVEAATKYIDDIIEQGMSVDAADLLRYQKLSEPYRNFMGVRKAAASAKGNRGNFTPKILARSALDDSSVQDLADVATEATADPVVGKFSRWTGLGGLPGALSLGAGRILSSEFLQKALMGDTQAQRALETFLQKNPEYTAQIGQAIRNMAATQTGSNFGE